MVLFHDSDILLALLPHLTECFLQQNSHLISILWYCHRENYDWLLEGKK